MDWSLLGWKAQVGYLPQLLAAYFIAFPVAWNRERAGRSAGLRTFPLVAVASCAYVLVGRDALGDDTEALGRILYGLMTGIGFIGGGAIVKEGGIAHGTATAASIWSTGAIGAAVAYNRYEIAVFVAGLTLLTLLVFTPMKGTVRGGRNPHREGSGEAADSDRE